MSELSHRPLWRRWWALIWSLLVVWCASALIASMLLGYWSRAALFLAGIAVLILAMWLVRKRWP